SVLTVSPSLIGPIPTPGLTWTVAVRVAAFDWATTPAPERTARGRPGICVGVVVGQSGSRSPNWILNASIALVHPRVRVHCGTAFWTARNNSLRAASSDGKLPLVLTALRS